MAATQTVSQFPQTHNSAVARHGVLVLFGYGIQVRVDGGHLVAEDGIGPERRYFRFPRVGHGLSRLVVIGSDGVVSLAALRWLADQDAAFVMLDRDGCVLVTTGPVRPSDARLRRAQGLAPQNGTALDITRELLGRKLDGQKQVARKKLLDAKTGDLIAQFREKVREAENIDAIRYLESQGAAAYWAAWRNLPINFPKSDLPRVPDHWRKFDTRKSPLSGSPRLATNPANAMLNYLYAVLESETRLAVSALGLDPGLGFWHVDTPNRDSLACDLMEPVRPHVDAYLLDWITRQPLKRSWFFEQRDGNCRLMNTLAIDLADTARIWGRSIAPIAEWVAQSLWNGLQGKGSRPGRKLSTPLTQRRRTEGRGNEFTPYETPAPRLNKICPGCGAQTRLGRHCSKCGREISKEKLIEIAKSGRIAALRPEARRKHSETHRRHLAERRAWLSVQDKWPDETTYIRDIQPRLAGVTISLISMTLGVCESYAADIRAGRYRPHARHWKKLAELVKVVPPIS
jgi:CRISPR-associated endonuclease Cas1